MIRGHLIGSSPRNGLPDIAGYIYRGTKREEPPGTVNAKQEAGRAGNRASRAARPVCPACGWFLPTHGAHRCRRQP